MSFNKNFFKSNTTATLEQAEQRMIEAGYSDFRFKNVSRSNGVSFYFELENGKEVRVSDHRLTGNRAFNTVQVDLFEIKTREDFKKPEVKKFELTEEMKEKARLRKLAMQSNY